MTPEERKALKREVAARDREIEKHSEQFHNEVRPNFTS